MSGSQVYSIGPDTPTCTISTFYKNSSNYKCQKASRCLGHLALPQITLGVLATLAGIVTVFIASVKLSFPFYLGADMWTGVVSITAGGIAYRIHSETSDGKLSKRTQRLMLAYGFLTLTCLCLGVVSLTMAGYVAYTCTDGYSSSDHCLPRKRANLALSIVDIVIESFVVVTSLLCFWKFCSYRYRFKPEPKPTLSNKMACPGYSQELKLSVRNTKKDIYITRNQPASQYNMPMYGMPRAHALNVPPYVHTRPPVHVPHAESVHSFNGYRGGVIIPFENGTPPPYTRISPY